MALPALDLSKFEVWDIETYPNAFTLSIGNMGSRKMRTFEISERKDERHEMLVYLRQIRRNKGWMVGFNSLGFDYPVLHYILNNQNCEVIEIYNKAMEIINYEGMNRFAFQISDRETMINQIDLYRVHHYDNRAKSTSLKALEFSMRMENIEDLPFPAGTWLKGDEFDTLVKYNKHDIKATALLFEKSKVEVGFRLELYEKERNRGVMNYNDTKIGKQLFIDTLERENAGSCYYRDQDGRRMMRQTKRPYINLGECLFPYVKFDRPEFQAVLDWVSNQVIYETKGVFSDLPEHLLGDVAKYAKMIEKRKKISHKREIAAYQHQFPKGWLVESTLKSGKTVQYFHWNIVKSLNVVVDGLEYVFGTGGLHASVDSQLVVAEDGWSVIDADVRSFYPNLAIRNRVFPEHLGELFCDIYLDLYNKRREYASGTTENGMLKLALNGTYGASNDQYSPLYDPKFTMMITINGQLSLSMLAEKLLEVEDLTIIQCNTDGLTYKCRDEDVERTKKICSDWERITNLELEYVNYKAMHIRDVNNYIAIGTDGKVKLKGAYEWENMGLHKNHSNLIIAMAVEQFVVNGTPVAETIMNHKDPYDFMARTKVPRSSRCVLIDESGIEHEQQNTVRYYVSNSGGTLIKIMPPLDKGKIVWDCTNPETGETERVETKGKMETRTRWGWNIKDVELPPEPRRFEMCKDQYVTTCNDMKTFKGFDDINYLWYIEQAEKLIDFSGEFNKEGDIDE